MKKLAYLRHFPKSNNYMPNPEFALPLPSFYY